MAIPRQFSGTLLGQQQPYAGAQIWGTGINPIHATRAGQGRNIAPDGKGVLVDPNLVDDSNSESYGYQDEDNIPWSIELAQMPDETGMGDRPSLGQDSEQSRGSTPKGYPYPAPTPSGVPRGENIRAREHGAIRGGTAVGIPAKSAAAGYLSKTTDGVIEPGAGISNPDQYIMQTSMMQLHRTREGSQSSGTASVYTQPIKTRVPGQKIIGYSGGYRHKEMRPREQTGIPWRPFFTRTAGTGKVQDLKPNVPIINTPRTRVPPPDPWQGQPVTATEDVYGYQGEDVVY